MAGAPFLNQTLTSERAAGTLVNTYTTAKTILTPTELVTIPANYLNVGSTFRIKLWGALSNVATTPGTMAFQIMMGSIIVWTSGNIQLNATAHTLLPFNLEVMLRVDSIGSGTAAKFIGGGYLSGIQPTLTAAQVDAINTPGMFPVPATAPAVGTGFDSTIANILDHWVGFSSNSASTGIQPYIYTVEQLF